MSIKKKKNLYITLNISKTFFFFFYNVNHSDFGSFDNFLLRLKKTCQKALHSA